MRRKFLMCLEDSHHREMELLVEAGLTPLEVLQAATVNVHNYYQQKYPVGVIRANMRADMLVLNDNPLDNIKNARNIDTVILAGKRLGPKQLKYLAAKLKRTANSK